jgi:phenylacetate-CoA ligase
MEIIGRADDMLNVKGVKVYPSAIQDVVTMFQPHVSGQLRIRLSGPPPRVEPPLKVVVEAGPDTAEGDWEPLARRIEQRTREILALRPAVTVVPFGTLPRSNQKTKLIEIV